jgi:hypothetical protein
MGPTFLSLTFVEMGECALLPHLIYFRLIYWSKMQLGIMAIG